ncbi:MAG: 4Fe-4S binding protein [Deltaproteobacteria bacterium]|jgi:NAD-dependent dihydropyrimidine dehydrogenase PreA subunit|nr:4Fe-4S binding protein [Deltaproteobacteria bacterium]
MGYSIKIDSSLCNGDGKCQDACPVEVYEVKGGVAVPVNLAECVGCESCVEACEVNAITITEE